MNPRNQKVIDFVTATYSSKPNPIDPVMPPVIKQVDGKPLTASVFTFELSAENPSNPMPDGSTDGVKRMSVIGPGRVEFGAWYYAHEGIYHYTVSEINTGAAGYIYDTNVYTITDTVWIENGQFKESRTITDSSGAEATELLFVNKYISRHTQPAETPDTSTPPADSPSRIGSTGDSPKTGDFSNPTLWIALIAIGSILLALLLFVGYRSGGGVQIEDEEVLVSKRVDGFGRRNRD